MNFSTAYIWVIEFFSKPNQIFSVLKLHESSQSASFASKKRHRTKDQTVLFPQRLQVWCLQQGLDLVWYPLKCFPLQNLSTVWGLPSLSNRSESFPIGTAIHNTDFLVICVSIIRVSFSDIQKRSSLTIIFISKDSGVGKSDRKLFNKYRYHVPNIFSHT